MSLTATGEKTILDHVGQFDLTAAEAIEKGDLVTADGYKADADVAAGRIAIGVALENAAVGDKFQAAAVAVIVVDPDDGGAGEGTELYLSDTPGDVSEAGSTTNPQRVGVELFDSQALLAPFAYAFTAIGASSGREAVTAGGKFAQWYLGFSGESGSEGFLLNIDDASTIASGRGRGIHIEYTSSGVKTGSAGVRTVAIDTTISANVPSWTGIDIYLAALGGENNYTVGNVFPLSIYVDDIGDNVESFCAVDIGINSSTKCNSRHSFFRCREHLAIVAGSAIMRLEGGNAASYFLVFDNPAGVEDSEVILDAATCNETADHRIRVHLEHTDVDRYIYLYPV